MEVGRGDETVLEGGSWKDVQSLENGNDCFCRGLCVSEAHSYEWERMWRCRRDHTKRASNYIFIYLNIVQQFHYSPLHFVVVLSVPFN